MILKSTEPELDVIQPRLRALALFLSTNIETASFLRGSSLRKASSRFFSARSRGPSSCSSAASIKRGTAKQSFLRSETGTASSSAVSVMLAPLRMSVSRTTSTSRCLTDSGTTQAGRAPVVHLPIGRPVTPCRNRYNCRRLGAVFQCLGRVRRPFGLMASQERRWRLESGRTALDADLDGLARVRFACRRSFH